MFILKSVSFFLFLAISSLPLFAQAMPDSIRRARYYAGDDVVIGIGMAKTESDWDSMSLAETQARAQIARAMDTEVKKTVNDYTAGSELTGETIRFSEEITVALSIVNIKNSWIAELVKESDGTWWCVVYWDRTNYVTEIDHAQAASRLAIPTALAFDAETRMDEAFERADMEDWFNNATNDKED